MQFLRINKNNFVILVAVYLKQSEREKKNIKIWLKLYWNIAKVRVFNRRRGEEEDQKGETNSWDCSSGWFGFRAKSPRKKFRLSETIVIDEALILETTH